MMTTEQALEVYRSTGAILKGHFKLTSGRHSDTYMQSAKVFVDPKASETLCKALAEKLTEAGVEVDVVISPAAPIASPVDPPMASPTSLNSFSTF